MIYTGDSVCYLWSMPDYLKRTGAKIWYRVAGRPGGAAVVYLHGGPGYNCYTFEHSAGVRLENTLQMIYVDQRMGGRSSSGLKHNNLDVDDLVEDLEELRVKLGFEKIGLLGHSFGGLVALEYLNRYPRRVQKIALVDISVNFAGVLANQIENALRFTERSVPARLGEVRAIAEGPASLIDKFMRMSDLVGGTALREEMCWFDSDARERHEALDKKLNLPLANYDVGISWIDRYLEGEGERLRTKLPVPGVLLVGRHSRAMGYQNLIGDARAWGIPMVWFEKSSHFPYVEQVEEFKDVVSAFFLA